MSHGPEHEMEHAEHAVHASHDDFNRRVTMSIAIVAAVLACVSMLGHRAQNETLRLQGEALSLQTRASIKSTEAANKWAYYQSKNTANLLSEVVVDMLDVLPIIPTRGAEANAIRERYEQNIAHYSGQKDARSTRREKGESASSGAEKKKPEGKLAKEKEAAEKLKEEAEETIRQANDKINESHVEHARAERFDYGELGLQFGVVLCSLAILMRERRFWFAGIISAAVGAAFALIGQLGLFLGGLH